LPEISEINTIMYTIRSMPNCVNFTKL